MKANRGSFLWLLILIPFLLRASQHHWEAEMSREDAVIGEAVLAEFVCHFDDAAYGTSIEIQLNKEDQNFRYAIYKESEHIIDGARENRYAFLLFPKRAGTLHVSLEALFKKTTREQVENAVIGRDNMESYQFAKTRETLPELTLHVSDPKANLVGSFDLSVHYSQHKVALFEPFHMTLQIDGTGNSDQIQPLAFSIEGVQQFHEAPKEDFERTKEGYRGSYIQKFAFVSEHNFSVPAINIRYFDTRTRSLKTLHHDAIDVTVASPYTKAMLLDEVDDETSVLPEGWIYYLLTLLTGSALGWYAHQMYNERQRKPKTAPLQKDAKTLLRDLALKGGHEALINRAEREQWSLKRIQNALESS